ncbi:MAG: ATP-binding protein [Chitinophagales bacterium]
MNLSFKDRIAFHYMIASAVIMALVCGVIYFIVQGTVFSQLDRDLAIEAQKHTEEIEIIQDSIHFINKAEWEEREHREIQVNPVFIQLIDKEGKLMDKSPNLKEDVLPFEQTEFKGHFNAELNGRDIRQVQLPIEENGNTKGYILAAMSSESSKTVVKTLRNVLIISYLVVLIGLYYISRFLAGRSIQPVQEISNTITRITRNNLKERVRLPENKDELFNLSSDFNELLERIENAIEREKQFTSDASHELRTPLATLRGTLEVLIRKPRTQAEYEEKISYCLSELERMSATLEQLLLLARLDTKAKIKDNNSISIVTLVDESLTRLKKTIEEKELKINVNADEAEMLVPYYYSSLIIDNVLSNAIKYSNKNASVTINLQKESSKIVCVIQDEGIGIKKEDLEHIYDNFFRSDALMHKNIYGNGLGLSIVKKCADAIHADLNIVSELGQGTTVSITF